MALRINAHASDVASGDGSTLVLMSKRDEPKEPTQKTPKGVEIPVPTRDAFLRDLQKVAPPSPKPANADE